MHVILDARKLSTKEEAHAYLKKVFRFPEYYGHNLDALYDSLTDLPYGDRLSVHFIHGKEAGEYCAQVISVLQDVPNAEIFYIDP